MNILPYHSYVFITGSHWATQEEDPKAPSPRKRHGPMRETTCSADSRGQANLARRDKAERIHGLHDTVTTMRLWGEWEMENAGTLAYCLLIFDLARAFDVSSISQICQWTRTFIILDDINSSVVNVDFLVFRWIRIWLGFAFFFFDFEAFRIFDRSQLNRPKYTQALLISELTVSFSVLWHERGCFLMFVVCVARIVNR